MSQNMGWVIVTFNQGSGGMPDHVEDSIFWDRQEAEEVAAQMRAETASVGRRDRHFVCELIEAEGQDEA